MKLKRLSRMTQVVSLGLVAALLATGCSSGGTGNASTGDTSKGPVTVDGAITVWVGSWWEPVIPKIKDAWKADHPDMPLDIQGLPINGFLDKFTSATLGGTPPDVMDLDTTWISTVAAKDLLQPLDDVASKLPAADYNPAVWEVSKFKGKQYTIPERGEAGVMYYNKTVFDKAGVAYPKDDWTYADLLATSEKLTIPGQYGMGIAADLSDPSNVMSTFAPVLWAMGGDFLAKDNKQAALNSPEGVKAITYWTELHTKYKVTPPGTPNYSTTRDLMPLFQTNKLGLIPGTSNTEDALAKVQGLQYGQVLAPGKVSGGGGYAMGIPVGAKNTDAAKVFIEWINQPEHMGQLLNRSPSRISARVYAPWNEPKYKIFTEASKTTRSIPPVAGWVDMQTALITNLQKGLIGQQTPQQVADESTKQINAIIQSNQ